MCEKCFEPKVARYPDMTEAEADALVAEWAKLPDEEFMEHWREVATRNVKNTIILHHRVKERLQDYFDRPEAEKRGITIEEYRKQKWEENERRQKHQKWMDDCRARMKAKREEIERIRKTYGGK